MRRFHNIEDLRKRAATRLPAPIFDFLDGGAESEVTLRQNTALFDDVKVVPRCLRDVGAVRTETRIMGQHLEWPLICSPTGASRLFHPDGELAVARAAARSGVAYALSTGSTYSIEAVADASEGIKIFQVYIYRDRAVTRALVERAKQAGYKALCITVDVPFVGKRERDLRHGLAIPMKLTPTSFVHFALRPRWAWGLRGGLRLGANLTPEPGQPRSSAAGKLDPAVTWRDIEEIIAFWGGPVALKGIMSVDDACQAADVGATAVIISNHGGRQLDGAATPIEVLPDIVKAVGNRLEVILDGGVRRGVHILKALALGANAVSVGRPYLYGLAAGGEAGVFRALELLREELVLSMQLAGCTNLDAIDDILVRHCE